MPDFIQGLALNRHFYHDIVQPILNEYFPDLSYSAALVGTGSEILGFDTEMSTDHHWGPRMMLFLQQADYDAYYAEINAIFRQKLPSRFQGYPVSYQASDKPEDHGTMLLDDNHPEGQPINHRVEIFALDTYFERYLNIKDVHNMSAADWLTCSEQSLLEMTAGEIYHDGLNMQALRDKLAYYPQDIWLYQMAAVWTRIGQEEHLAPRAGYVGDNIGSWLIAARLTRDMMRLCFLMERRYAPYPKWFGMAFKQLACAAQFSPLLEQILSGDTWQKREAALCEVYEALAEKHNQLNITPPLEISVRHFHGRPFKVLEAWRFGNALREQITDSTVQAIAKKTQIGGIDIFSDNTDFLEDMRLRPILRQLYS